MFKSAFKRFSFLTGLIIAFAITMAMPSTAIASVDYGWSVLTHDFGASAFHAEPLSLHGKRQKGGAKDTALDMYAVLPVIGKSAFRDSLSSALITKIDGRSIVQNYKDRPGW